MAFEQLSSDEQETIRPFKYSTDIDLQRLQVVVEEKRNLCIEKSWKVRIHGREIILQDVASKIISSIRAFISIGDVVVSFDPVHAALPWAGVRSLLQITIAGDEQMGALLAGIEKVAYLLSRCKVYELLYLQKMPPDQEDSKQATQNLRVTMVSLYAGILGFLAKASMLYSKGTIGRTVHGILKPLEIEGFLKDFQSLEERLGQEVSNCERVYYRNVQKDSSEVVKGLQRILMSLAAPVLQVESHVSELYEKMESAERAQVLMWISPIPHEKAHLNARHNRTQDTGKWLLNHSLYLQWKESSTSGILWLHGMPGTGKSKLVSSVVDDLRSTVRHATNNGALAFFYCNRNQNELRDPASVFPSFVRQLSIIPNSNLVQKSIVQLYKEKQQDGFSSGTMELEESIEVLSNLTRLIPRTTLVIDALDECYPESRGSLVNILHDLMSKSPNPLKVFISSRPDRDLDYRFKGGPNLEIRATDNRSDIEAFIDDRIANSEPLWQGKIGTATKALVRNRLVEKSGGMFQWVKLQMDFLLTMLNEDDILERLRTLPPTTKLVDTYDEIYNIIQKKPGRMPVIAARAFQWLMCSTRVVSPERLVAAVCQDPDSGEIERVNVDMDDILGACHNLLVLDRDREICQFSHLSVWEYLETHHWDFEQANGLAAKVCLSLLNHPTVVHIQTTFVQDPKAQLGQEMAEHLELWNRHVAAAGFVSNIGALIRYAQYSKRCVLLIANSQTLTKLVLGWPVHVQRHGQERIDGVVTVLLKGFLGSMNESSVAYRTWHSFISTKTTDDHDFDPLPMMHMAHYNTLRPSSSASLAIALYGFHKVILDWWDHGFQDINQRNDEGMTLLHLAAMGDGTGRDATSTLQALLDNGADIEAKRGLQIPYSGPTPLTIACKWRNEAAMKFLLDNGADPNPDVSGLGGPLHIAVLFGIENLVDLLLERGVNVNGFHGSKGVTALNAAIREGDEDIVKRLIANGADVNLRSKRGIAPLDEAAWNGFTDIMRMLFEHGAGNRYTGGDPDSALLTAVKRGKEEAVRLLLVHGADAQFLCPNTRDSMLQIATESDYKEIVDCLVEYGADPSTVIDRNPQESDEEFKIRKTKIYDQKKEIKSLPEEGKVEVWEQKKEMAQLEAS